MSVRQIILVGLWAVACANGQDASPFLPVPPAPTDQLRFAAPFPAFEAKDISGRTWRTEDLRGRFTLIYIWNTFQAVAPPALQDLPELQRFYSKVKGAANVQVLTFCTDYDYTHAPEYMKRNQFTFPVIADWTLIRKLFPMDNCQQGCRLGIPSPTPLPGGLAAPHWVVNPEGQLSSPLHVWALGRLLFEVEKDAAVN